MIRLSFDLFGHRIGGITIDLNLPDTPDVVSRPFHAVVKGVTRAWVDRVTG